MIKYEKRKLSALIIDDGNPRVISKSAKRALAASLKRFGLVQPIVVNKTTGQVVGGHQRIEALREQGVTDVDVVVGEWSADEQRALNVTLNNPAAHGEFTGGVRNYLADSLKTMSLSDFQALKLDKLVLQSTKDGESVERRDLEYKLVISCDDEAH